MQRTIFLSEEYQSRKKVEMAIVKNSKTMQSLLASLLVALSLLASLLVSEFADTSFLAPIVGGGSSVLTQGRVDSPDFDLGEIPVYAGEPSVEVAGNLPYFSEEELSRGPFETYSALDWLGRCGPAYALIGTETMPTEKRGNIGMIKPSGWQIAEYDWIDGRYLFNRCHLIAFSLAAENDNELNLITGTRSMNVQGMLPYEEKIASYVRETNNHVLYRVTPLFEGNNLIASGVLMEAQSIEDGGVGIRFCVWCYNVEPGVEIDYATGNNRAGDPTKETYSETGAQGQKDGPEAAEKNNSTAVNSNPENLSASSPTTYVINLNTRRFHQADCSSVSDIHESNKQVYEGTREELSEKGYEPCGSCQP